MAPPLSNFLETFLYATIWILLFSISVSPSIWLVVRRHLRFHYFSIFSSCVLYENQISIQLLPHNTHFDSFACTLTCYCGVIGYFEAWMVGLLGQGVSVLSLNLIGTSLSFDPCGDLSYSYKDSLLSYSTKLLFEALNFYNCFL